MRREISLCLAALIIVFSAPAIGTGDICGDCNNDGDLNLLDINYLIAYLYQGGPAPDPLDMADVDLNGSVNILDITFIIDHLYYDGPVPCSDRPWPENQQYLFEVYYVNYAWGYFNYGSFVDTQGYIYQFDHSFDYWEPADQEAFTQAELDEKYIYSYPVGYIDMDSLIDKYNMIYPASLGPDSARPYPCFDAGAYIYQGFLYDPGDSRYHRVLFYQAGDIGMTNLSPEAIALTEWLKIIDPRFADPFCP